MSHSTCIRASCSFSKQTSCRILCSSPDLPCHLVNADEMTLYAMRRARRVSRYRCLASLCAFDHHVSNAVNTNPPNILRAILFDVAVTTLNSLTLSAHRSNAAFTPRSLILVKTSCISARGDLSSSRCSHHLENADKMALFDMRCTIHISKSRCLVACRAFSRQVSHATTSLPLSKRFTTNCICFLMRVSRNVSSRQRIVHLATAIHTNCIRLNPNTTNCTQHFNCFDRSVLCSAATVCHCSIDRKTTDLLIFRPTLSAVA
mmetsp:Transcript_6516/g.10347  ORF Transcript_6516/g.10347 Transcript_6516/m.10347 type:complete len:261 (+) Transcript_6516:1298-2080(+)